MALSTCTHLILDHQISDGPIQEGLNEDVGKLHKTLHTNRL
jgi:hypothetical protein